MKRAFYLLTICISITIYSCAKDVLPKPKEITNIDNTLTLDRQAKTVKDLKSLLVSIDSTLIKTRIYKERNKKCRSYQKYKYRDSSASVEVDSLLFIINFKDEKGYALVGANDYFDGILAIVDSGNISAKEFLCTKLINLDSDIHILHNQILNYTIQTINKNSSFHTIQGYYSTDGWTMSIMVPAMLKTRWHQYAPYNMYCPEKMVNIA